MTGKFEIDKAKNGEFIFRLKAGNGQVILSSEQYAQKGGAKSGIRSVKSNSAKEASFERKTATNGKSYFTLSARNGEVIGKSQMYKSVSGRENGIKSVAKNASDAPIVDLTA